MMRATASHRPTDVTLGPESEDVRADGCFRRGGQGFFLVAEMTQGALAVADRFFMPDLDLRSDGEGEGEEEPRQPHSARPAADGHGGGWPQGDGRCQTAAGCCRASRRRSWWL